MAESQTKPQPILEYRNNMDETVTVLIKGNDVGTFATVSMASDAVDKGITAGIQNLAKKVGVGGVVSEINKS